MARRTRQEWQALINTQSSSGQKASEFCRERGISPSYFSSKKRQILSTDSRRFLKVIGQPEISEIGRIEPRSDRLRTTQCLRVIELELGAVLDADALVRLLKGLLR